MPKIIDKREVERKPPLESGDLVQFNGRTFLWLSAGKRYYLFDLGNNVMYDHDPPFSHAAHLFNHIAKHFGEDAEVNIIKPSHYEIHLV